MVARLALAAALVLTAAPIAAQDNDADDPYIWLEEIQGERALAKVDQFKAQAVCDCSYSSHLSCTRHDRNI